MIHDTKNVGKPTVLTCRFPTFYGCLLHREKVITKLRSDTKQSLVDGIANKTTTLAQLHAKFGAHGLPQTVDEYRQVQYNKDESRALRGYITSRNKGTVEPVVTYKDYLTASSRLKSKLVGSKTSDGKEITGYSNHTVERVFGTRQDASHENNRREGVSIDHIKSLLSTGIAEPTRGSMTKYSDDSAYLVVNSLGKLVTVVPRKSRK